MEPIPKPMHSFTSGTPDDEHSLIPWSRVVEQLQRARNYWVCTVGPDGAPHATPVWCSFVGGTLYFGGDDRTRRGRHLADNRAVAVHLESTTDVVIVEGTVEEVTPDPQLALLLAQEAAVKYGMESGPEQWMSRTMYAVHPRVVFAWNGEFRANATRHVFPDQPPSPAQ